ncbi:hypothetical protein Aph01nite_43240 [Acrocarpospora phusangensis]|uniref:Uncharacterized protein n=1 Tax=Acrocarpospora phusangensis TaxID=1070424 RepID=A0A919ULI4_9ACTN|nr:hypothetical protein [Acrocarpospora phusangensis]GIH26014.1 hypothetical protein Aph01nite_43240 [Acrocarpospora phusangensis]
MTETDTQTFPAVPPPVVTPPHVKRRFAEVAALEIAAAKARYEAEVGWWQAVAERVERDVPDPAAYHIGRPPYGDPSIPPFLDSHESGRTTP